MLDGRTKINLTVEQQNAVQANGDVLIVAGAGTGKTATLVSRCEKFIFDEQQPVPINRILLVTFTEAAAAEMRLRIRKRVEDILFSSADNSTALKQLALLPVAHISTLHSFCFNLVRLHFNKLGLDPQVSVIEEGQARAIALKVLDEIFNEHYSGNSEFDERVKKLIAERARGWDVPIREMVLNIYYFSQSLPDSRRWLSRQSEIYSDKRPTHWEEILTSEFHIWRAEWKARLASARSVENIARCYSALNEIENSAHFYQVRQYIDKIKDALESKWQRGTATLKREILNEFVKDINFFHSILPDGTENGSENNPINADWQLTREQIKTLIELVLEFEEKFSAAKREISVVDFNDLEQMTIKLLIDEDENPTPLARELQQQYELVFVDEYQDINPAQHAIISAICRQGKNANRFIVGDVKQSIYRFRRANPHIFQKLTKEWSKYQKDNNNPNGEKNVFYLSRNFRSHPSILNFVNSLFSIIMVEQVCGIEYTTDVYLVSGLDNYKNEEFKNQDDLRVELHLILQENDEAVENGEDEENPGEYEPTVIQKEAALIAERLKKLKRNGFLILDRQSGKHRPVDWKDMVVLLRSPATRAEIYAQEFNARGVPFVIPYGNIFNAIETKDIINLLKLLDNPLQDLPLAAVLRSPLVGFTLAELTFLRFASKHTRLWTALRRFLSLKEQIRKQLEEKFPDTAQRQVVIETLESAYKKGTHFVDSYEKWRKIARQVSLSHCLETIYDDTQYCAWCLAQSDGVQKHSNIQLLLEITRQFDPLQRQGLTRFLQYIEQCQNAEIEIEPAAIEGENAVRLMSIHQSKGLEFPVVCVADLGKRFNLQDLNSDIILDEELGICPKVHPQDFSQSYPSPAFWAARRRNLRETIGEEIRLLYVATTRACDLLILSGSAPKKTIEKLKLKCSTRAIFPEDISRCAYPLQWICLWLWSYYYNLTWSDMYLGKLKEVKLYVDSFKYSTESEAAESVKSCHIEVSPEMSDELAELNARLSWRYPFFNATKEPAKTSVSEVRKRIVEISEESKTFFKPPHRIIVVGPDAENDRIPAVVRGEAYHKFLELLDLERCSSIDDVQAELKRLLEAGKLSDVQAKAIDPVKVYNFWCSDTGRLLLSRKNLLRRELPFTARIATDETEFRTLFHHLEGLENEFVVIQGVIDLCMVSQKEIWLLDYKTDEIKPEEIELKNKHYVPQIDLYSYALTRIYNVPVSKKWIHYLHINTTVEIK
jgi:ATP-dependent helicase/nuclease subunit A